MNQLPENIQLVLNAWRKGQAGVFRRLLETKTVRWNTPVKTGKYRWEGNLAEYLMAITDEQLNDAGNRAPRIFDKTRMVEILIDSGWNSNRVMSNGKVPILYAIESGQGKLAEMLLRHNQKEDWLAVRGEYVEATVQALYERRRMGVAENGPEVDGLRFILKKLLIGGPEISDIGRGKIWKLILLGKLKEVAVAFLENEPGFDPNFSLKKIGKLNSPTILYGMVEHGLVVTKDELDPWVASGGDMQVADYHRRNLIQASMAGLVARGGGEKIEWDNTTGWNITTRQRIFEGFCELVVWLNQQAGLMVNSGGAKDKQFGKQWDELKLIYRRLIEQDDSLQDKVNRVDALVSREYLEKVLPKAGVAELKKRTEPKEKSAPMAGKRRL